ncbi:hypothetical protein ACPEIC_36385 [Stenotrophomonas sp. NPDC087984]
MDQQEYDLSVDGQADSLIELKQKWVYFIVTAATAIVVFSSKFALDYGKEFNRESIKPGGTVRWLVASALFATLAVGFALISIHLGHKSFERHVSFRYRGVLPDADEVKQWDDLSAWQRRVLGWSAASLVASTGLAFCYFNFLLW